MSDFWKSALSTLRSARTWVNGFAVTLLCHALWGAGSKEWWIAILAWSIADTIAETIDGG